MLALTLAKKSELLTRIKCIPRMTSHMQILLSYSTSCGDWRQKKRARVTVIYENCYVLFNCMND